MPFVEQSVRPVPGIADTDCVSIIYWEMLFTPEETESHRILQDKLKRKKMRDVRKREGPVVSSLGLRMSV